MLVSARDMTQAAKVDRFAVGAFNVTTIDAMASVARVATGRRSPVIAMVWAGAAQFTDLPALTKACASIASNAEVPVALHLDHCDDINLVSDLLDAGVSSVMFDGANLGLDDNIRRTNEVRQLVNSHGASLEGVVGRIGDETAHAARSTPREVQVTDRADAGRYVAETNVDMLAIAVGTQHGRPSGEHVRLDASLVRDVATLSGIPLVLHGGSFAPDADVAELIAVGVCKVNVATELDVSYMSGIRELDLDAVLYSSELSAAGCAALERLLEDKFELFGSTGKA